MRMSIVGLVALGLIAAFSAALLMAALGKPVTSSMSSNGDREVTVLIAKHDIPSVSRVRSEDLVERTMMLSEAPAGAITDSIHAVGHTLAHPLLEGEAITKDSLTGNTRGSEMVSSLPPGMRAVTVELKHAAGLEGLLYPGSVVDVLMTYRLERELKEVGDAISTTLLNGVKVLAIDHATSMDADEESDKASKGGALSRSKTRRVTLLVDSRQAEALQLATVHGTVSLAMRNPNDTTNADHDATLLSGGQLASLAEYLGTRVEASEVGPSDQGNETDTGQSIKTPRSTTREWDVTVMRGNTVEVQSFKEQRNNGDVELLY